MNHRRPPAPHRSGRLPVRAAEGASRSWRLGRAVQVVRRGGVIAYPTEAVYGLGCDPADDAAVRRLLGLKRRARSKGLILVAADLDQLHPFIRPLEPGLKHRVLATWPGAITWVLPARAGCPEWLRGEHDTLAVRVPGHAQCVALCRALGHPLVSTSANLSGRPPARSALKVRLQFGRAVDYVLNGQVGNRLRPSEIRDGRSGAVLRPG